MSTKIEENWWVFPGFEIKKMVTGLELPVNLAFVKNSSENPNDPLLYVSELYGKVKVITNNWKVHTFAEGLLNYKPDYRFPGTGESGVTGICVEPKSGDVFVSFIYQDNNKMKNKVVRFASQDGLKADSKTTLIDNIPSVHAAHQIQALTIGFDNKLYINIGDGMADPSPAQDDNDLRGKILRLNLDGSIPSDNPNPKSAIFAKGFRNPFGARFRKFDQSLYISDNGPDVDDRIAKVVRGKNYGWPRTMRENAIFNWNYTQAPTALDFMQNGEFPDNYKDELFVALFGAAYHKGRSVKGKKIIKVKLSNKSDGVVSYDEFVTYIGEGLESPCGLSFGPGGLYFTDLHGGSIYLIKPLK